MERSSLQRLAQALQTLQKLSTAASLAWPEKIRELLDFGCLQLGMPNGIVARVSGEEYEIVQARSANQGIERGRVFALGDSLCRQTVLGQGLYCLERIEPASSGVQPTCCGLPLGAYVGVPLVTGEQLYGTLNFFSPEPRPRPFSDTDREIVKLMGQWLGGELLRHRSHDQLQETIREMRALNRVVRAGNRSLYLDEVAQAVLAEIGAAVAPDIAILFRCQQGKLQPIAAQPPELLRRAPGCGAVRRGECLCGLAAQGAPIFAVDLNSDARASLASCTGLGIHSFVAVPVRHGRETLGVLGLGSRSRRDFRRHENFLDALADHIGSALQSACLYEQGLHHIEQMEKKVCELQDAEQRLRLSWFLLDNAGDGVFLLDRHGRFRQVNKKAGALLGYGVEELLKLSVSDIDPLITPQAWQQQWDRVREQGAETMVSVHVRQDGSSLPVEVRSNYLEYEGEGYQCAFVRDITEQLNAEKEKEKVTEQLIQAQKMECVGRLAGGIAHDFNNLLSSIIGYCELTLLKLEPEHPCYQKIQTIHKSGERAAALTRQLLSFSRKQKMTMAVTNLNFIIENIVKMVTRLIGEDILLDLALHKPLKNIKGDAGQIEQILLNLVINARDAMPGGGKLIIATGEEAVAQRRTTLHGNLAPGHYVTLEVRDTGHGISPEYLSRIFEPFFTTKEVDKGTGLGLATVYALVGLHKGHIEVESETGCGTRFRLYFPAVELARLPEQAPQGRNWLARGKETILLVDDERDIRQLLVDILEPLGYQLVVAGGGEEALRAAAAMEQPVRLLLTDVVMPRMSGLELAQQLRAQYPEVKVLFMSGFLGPEICDFEAFGDSRVLLQKPITPHQLATTIRKLLDEEG